MSAQTEYPRTVFIYELITGGGLFAVDGAPAPSGSLLHEGTAMLAAVAEDFSAIAGTSVTILRDQRIEPLSVSATQQIAVRSAAEEREAFRTAVRETDATLIIAPEFDGLLLERTLWAEEEDAWLLSPNSTFVEVATCKWKTFQVWQTAGVPTIETHFLADSASWQHLREVEVVTKPRDGAGSEEVLCWKMGKQVEAQLPLNERILIQPKVYGTAISCAIFGSGVDIVPLPAGYQRLSKDLKYHGGRLPLPEAFNERAHRLTGQAIRSFPPFRGYVGLDMILGPCPEGTEDVAVEINPRLTSSYVGLRLLLKNNLAQAMLDVAAGKAFVPQPGCGDVDFEIH
ncbi:ATP-grasp domain-containing protein [Bremerella cremea]|uniref:ATP-grasp domain-containing protein n=1 Tax=Bremerella cremea TaxID=1031537 RepID=A0A368KXA6_9BACT|nr:ATP-grasp domain-containing protein [Bremerella cremea]RCS55970.1 ATP-grasp domain-containing protein [Bremerella cremea]